MTYTVHQVAAMSGVTIKTLYHYHKLGLLLPKYITEKGYRFYGEAELLRLQQILFFRELDFSLAQIKTALDNQADRLSCLQEQYQLLQAKEERLAVMLNTLAEALDHERKGVKMNTETMFEGLNKEQWQAALKEQNQHLQKEYEFAVDTENVDAVELNEKAAEAASFMDFMAEALRSGKRADQDEVRQAIETHLAYLNQDMTLDANGFAAQCRFFVTDDFHRAMLESQQIGLSYYLCVAAEQYAVEMG